MDDARPKDGPPGKPEKAPALATELTGDLPCIGCGYNLNGLSIRAMCPECGMAVRATILAMVDPMAEELRPIRRPVVVAYGLIVWAWSAIVAAVAVWADRLADVAGVWLGRPMSLGWPEPYALGAIALSGLAALTLVRPFERQSAWDSVKAGVGVLAYVPLLLVHHLLHGWYDEAGVAGVPFIGPDGMDTGRSLLRLAENLLIVIVVLGLRENLVVLAERSLVMRTGRVDTQPVVALAGSLALASLGDMLHLSFGWVNGVAGDLLYTLQLVLIAVGSFLFTLGLAGIGFDAIRLRPVILKPAPGLSDILGFEGHREDA